MRVRVLTNIPFRVAVALLWVSAAHAYCDVSETSDEVMEARALSASELEEIYVASLAQLRDSPRGRVSDPSLMPSALAKLKPVYLQATHSYLWVRLGGCVDAAVMLTISENSGVELSWGEDCPDCSEVLWRPSVSSSQAD